MSLPVLAATVVVLALVFYAGMRTQRLLWWKVEQIAEQRGWDTARATLMVRPETDKLYRAIRAELKNDDTPLAGDRDG